MQLLSKWVLPISIAGIGIAILAGLLFPHLPKETGLRYMLGVVVLLMGVHRFVASRTARAVDRRPYGGERQKPWEKQ